MPDDLIPLAVRIALRNAVGGWGPYTVREIADLFGTHGFLRRDPNVEDAGGARRTEVEAHQAEIDFRSAEQAHRYLDLVEEVLEEYPEDATEVAPAGLKLRRELRRAHITSDPSGRLELPAIRAAQVSERLERAAEGVWTPERIRVFLSHTSAHRTEVGQLANDLNRYAFSCFVAHDAIEPTRQWQEVIEQALRTCDVLVAFVTEDFNNSQWTDQEVGWALGRELVVIPLKVGADPYGFFGSYQALPVAPNQSAWETAVAITRAVAVAVFGEQRPGARRLLGPMTDLVVEAFCLSPGFDAMRRRYDLLRLVPPSAWRAEHLQRLEKAAQQNLQIREGTIEQDGTRPAPEVISELIARFGDTAR